MFPATAPAPMFRRLELARNDDVPTQVEVRSYLGSSLAEVAKNYSHDTSKKLLGVIPPLAGCQDEVWISPSDRLIGKVALKPPLTDKSIKACTHQGILEIGRLVALRFEERSEDNMRKRLEEEIEEIRKMFEAEKRQAIQVNVRNTRMEYEEYITGLNQEFTMKLKTALEEATKKSEKEMQKAVVRERMEVTTRMMKKLRDEIGDVVDCLDLEFEQSLSAKTHNMIADFNAIMRRERKKADAAMKSLDKKKAVEMYAQRRQLETQNMADAACILCTERMRCSTEKDEIHRCFQKQVEALRHELLVDLTKALANEEITEIPKNQRHSNETSELFQVVEIIDKDGNTWRPIDPNAEIPQLDSNEEDPTFSIKPSEEKLLPSEHYERVSKPSAKSLSSYESLPFCYVEEKLYVRSDCKQVADIPSEKKKMSELAEDARIIMGLKRFPKSCCKRLDDPEINGEIVNGAKLPFTVV